MRTSAALSSLSQTKLRGDRGPGPAIKNSLRLSVVSVAVHRSGTGSIWTRRENATRSSCQLGVGIPSIVDLLSVGPFGNLGGGLRAETVEVGDLHAQLAFEIDHLTRVPVLENDVIDDKPSPFAFHEDFGPLAFISQMDESRLGSHQQFTDAESEVIDGIFRESGEILATVPDGRIEVFRRKLFDEFQIPRAEAVGKIPNRHHRFEREFQRIGPIESGEENIIDQKPASDIQHLESVELLPLLDGDFRHAPFENRQPDFGSSLSDPFHGEFAEAVAVDVLPDPVGEILRADMPDDRKIVARKGVGKNHRQIARLEDGGEIPLLAALCVVQ